jgi:hypothetical protein
MNLKRTLKDRVTRTLILSMAFFFSGLAFFGFRMFDGGEQTPSQQFMKDTAPHIEEKERLIPSLAGYPEPEVFHQFTYTRGVTLTVEGQCKDSYYVVMVYGTEVDYRAAPMDARFNTAYPCTGDKFAERIPIDTLFLKEGTGYYVIKAHQGEKGYLVRPLLSNRVLYEHYY